MNLRKAMEISAFEFRFELFMSGNLSMTLPIDINVGCPAIEVESPEHSGTTDQGFEGTA
jgi:hypothetical protein